MENAKNGNGLYTKNCEYKTKTDGSRNKTCEKYLNTKRGEKLHYAKKNKKKYLKMLRLIMSFSTRHSWKKRITNIKHKRRFSQFKYCIIIKM